MKVSSTNLKVPKVLKSEISKILNQKISMVEARNRLGHLEGLVESGGMTWTDLKVTPEKLVEAIRKIEQRERKKSLKKLHMLTD